MEDDIVVEVGTGDDLIVEVTHLVIGLEAAGLTVHVMEDIMIEVIETEETIAVIVAVDPGVTAEVGAGGIGEVEIVAENQRGIEKGGGEAANAVAQVAEVIGDPPLALVLAGVRIGVKVGVKVGVRVILRVRNPQGVLVEVRLKGIETVSLA